MNKEKNINLEKTSTKLAKTNLSLISLILTILQFVVPLITYFIDSLSFLEKIPYVIISLILAIISKCKYSDKLSLIMIIINAIIIGLEIIFLILMVLFFATAIDSIITGCTSISA